MGFWKIGHIEKHWKLLNCSIKLELHTTYGMLKKAMAMQFFSHQVISEEIYF